MEISKYDKDSLVGIIVFVAIASLLYFFLDVGWWITLLGVGLIALFADMRRLESIIGEVRERLVKIESGLESLLKAKKQ